MGSGLHVHRTPPRVAPRLTIVSNVGPSRPNWYSRMMQIALSSLFLLMMSCSNSCACSLYMAFWCGLTSFSTTRTHTTVSWSSTMAVRSHSSAASEYLCSSVPTTKVFERRCAWKPLCLAERVMPEFLEMSWLVVSNATCARNLGPSVSVLLGATSTVETILRSGSACFGWGGGVSVRAREKFVKDYREGGEITEVQNVRGRERWLRAGRGETRADASEGTVTIKLGHRASLRAKTGLVGQRGGGGEGVVWR